MEDIKLKDCEIINLKINDIVIYKSNKNKKDVSNFEIEELVKRLKLIFPKNKCFILFNGDDIKIARNSKVK